MLGEERRLLLLDGEALLRALWEAEVVGNREHGFPKRRIAIPGSFGAALWLGLHSTGGWGRVSDLVRLGLCRVFDAVPQDILVSKCKSHGLDGWSHGVDKADGLQRCFAAFAWFWLFVILWCWPDAGNVYP